MISLESSAIVKVNRDGVIIKKAPEVPGVEKRPNYLYPSNEEVIWEVNTDLLST